MGVLNGARTQHRYQTCRDELCNRFACRVYKEGRRDGYDEGYAEGYLAGQAAGYAEGYAAGAADTAAPEG
jgi:flagellar biosynthesis/type III secretory pathway protein FliH